MEIGRRSFLKVSATAGVLTAFGGLGISLGPIKARAEILKLKETKQTTSVCCYCAVGCGLIVHTDKKTKRAVDVEGDPDHPVNQGSLCAKGASAKGVVENPMRVQQVMYRAPYSDKWEKKSWDWALDRIAKKVKEARDASFIEKNAKGEVVNRCETMASVGSAALDNEECWTYQALLRSLGLVYVEHQARI